MRQPAMWVPPLIFPTALMLVNAGGLASATKLPGFPTESFLAFALAVPFIQGALFATMNAGTELARDMQIGFLNRLALTPMRGSALLAGQLAGVVVLGLVQAVFYSSSACSPASASRPARRRRRAARSSRRRLARLRRARCRSSRSAPGSGEAVQGLFPRVLRLPLHLVDEHAAQPDRRSTGSGVATLNPVSYLIEWSGA